MSSGPVIAPLGVVQQQVELGLVHGILVSVRVGC